MSVFRPLPRRTFLRGSAASIGLPLLEAMLPRGPRAYAAATPAKKFVVFHMPNGMSANHWNFTSSLKPIEDAGLKNDVSIVRGLRHSVAGEVSGAGHTAGVMALLSGIAPGTGDKLTKTLDQYIADTSPGLRRRSLHLGTQHSYDFNQGKNFEGRGLGLRVKEYISWQNENTPNAFIMDPAEAYEFVFGAGGAAPSPTMPAPDAAAAKKQATYDKAVLNTAMDHATALEKKLGREDKRRLEEWLTHVSALEKRILVDGPAGPGTAEACMPGAAPAKPTNHEDKMRKMLDVTVAALRCDATHVVTFQFDTTVNGDGVVVPGVYHFDVVHAAKWEDVAKFNRWQVEHLCRLLTALKGAKELDGSTMLDNTAVMFTSELGNGSAHNHVNLPFIIGGRAGGKLLTGKDITLNNTEAANLHLTLLRAFGAMAPVRDGKEVWGARGTGVLESLLA